MGCFEVHGAMPNVMQEVWNKIFTEWFPSNGYEHTMTPELEVYTDGDPSSESYYSEIWIPVKKGRAAIRVDGSSFVGY